MELLLKYFKDTDAGALEMYKALPDIYGEWNNKINLISRKDIIFFEERHLLHSLSIAKIIKFKAGSKVLDAGTGGGLPGIPLAIMFPDVQFCLVDSIAKKCKVVKAVAGELGLSNVEVKNGRAEDLKDKYDFVVSRALAPLPLLWKWTGGLISQKSFNDIPNGLLCLKGGELSSELEAGNWRYNIWELSQLYEEEFFITKKLVHSYK